MSPVREESERRRLDELLEEDSNWGLDEEEGEARGPREGGVVPSSSARTKTQVSWLATSFCSMKFMLVRRHLLTLHTLLVDGQAVCPSHELPAHEKGL